MFLEILLEQYFIRTGYHFFLWNLIRHKENTVPSRKLLVIYLSIQHFWRLLEGRIFRVFTDHKPLTYALHAKTDTYTPRNTTFQFTLDIRYIKGSNNIVADTLSCSMIQSIESKPLNFDLIAKEQQKDTTWDTVKQNTSLQLKEHHVPFSTKTLLHDISTGYSRPYVLPSMHNFSHSGCRATAKLISDRFVWPNMCGDIKHWTQTCLNCQKSKVNRHTKSPVGQSDKPDARFTNLHVDLVGPLPEVEGYHYLLTIID